jgi:hypothetical protein
MDTLIDAVIKEVPKLGTGVVLLGLAWLVGQRLTYSWNLRQKQKESDLATLRDFQSLYGEFFAIWKLWNYLIRDITDQQLEGASRWALLDRASTAEGKLEATLVRIACDNKLSSDQIELLGTFRQLYQTMRQAIRENQPLTWDSSDHPDYVMFKRLAPKVGALIVGHRFSSGSEVAGESIVQITSNRWEPN